MTHEVQESARRARFVVTAPGGQTNFPIPFPVMIVKDKDFNDVIQLAVYVDGDEAVNGYDVDLDILEVQFDAELPQNTVVVLEGRSLINRKTGYPLRGGLLSGQLNNDMNRIIQMIQELARDLRRAIILNKAESDDVRTTLPQLLFGHMLIWGAEGLENGPDTTDVAAVAQHLEEIDSLSPIVAEIGDLAGIKAQLLALYDIRAQMAAAGAEIESIVTVAGDLAGNEYIKEIALDIRGDNNLGAVGAQITKVVNVANSLVPLLALEDELDKIGALYARRDEIDALYGIRVALFYLGGVVTEIEDLYAIRTKIATAADNIADIVQAAEEILAIKAAPGAAESAANSADLAAAWSEGHEPGGPGTKSAKEHAEDAASIVLGDWPGLSVLARSGSTTGPAEAVTAAADGQVLLRDGSTLKFGKVKTAGIEDEAVDNDKLAKMPANTMKINPTGAAAKPQDGDKDAVWGFLGPAPAREVAGVSVSTGTKTVNFSDGDVHTITATGNFTLEANIPSGQAAVVRCIDFDAHTITVSFFEWGDAGAPDFTGDDIIVIFRHGSDYCASVFIQDIGA